jgi:hypothetical protein
MKQWMVNQIIQRRWFTTIVILMAIIMSTPHHLRPQGQSVLHCRSRARGQSEAIESSNVASSWWSIQCHKINWHLSHEFEQSNGFQSRERSVHSGLCTISEQRNNRFHTLDGDNHSTNKTPTNKDAATDTNLTYQPPSSAQFIITVETNEEGVVVLDGKLVPYMKSGLNVAHVKQ